MQKIINSRNLREGDSLNLQLSGKHLLLVRKQHRVVAYINHCPHLGLRLERQNNNFLNSSSSHIQCSNHQALFEIASGLCVSGPCAGAALKSIPCQEFDGAIWTNMLDN